MKLGRIRYDQWSVFEDVGSWVQFDLSIIGDRKSATICSWLQFSIAVDLFLGHNACTRRWFGKPNQWIFEGRAIRNWFGAEYATATTFANATRSAYRFGPELVLTLRLD